METEIDLLRFFFEYMKNWVIQVNGKILRSYDGTDLFSNLKIWANYAVSHLLVVLSNSI